jgi:endonuclease/exonuclease/phosphatase family metal-dependent hydrolase
MKLLSWNIQWCRGVDGRVDAQRIAREIRAMADADVICLQEVARNFDTLPGSQRQTVPVTARERGVLAAGAALPDRAHGVDDPAGAQAEPRGDARLARGAAPETAAVRE